MANLIDKKMRKLDDAKLKETLMKTDYTCLEPLFKELGLDSVNLINNIQVNLKVSNQKIQSEIERIKYKKKAPK